MFRGLRNEPPLPEGPLVAGPPFARMPGDGLARLACSAA